MIQVDPRGIRLLVCTAGDCYHYEYVKDDVKHCPSCGTEQVVRPVDCASSMHNEPGGCDNPECWKYHEKR